MRRAAAALGLFIGVGLATCADPAERPVAGPLLLLPGAGEPFRLHLDVRVAGQPPTASWDAFLDRLFAWFDRDGDGSLSRAEVARMFALPLADGRELTFDFARLDADGNGKVTRTELGAFCRSNGFGPVVAVVEPPSADDLRLADLFLRRLDADGDGKLTRAELQRAPELLRRYDLNEDEFLDPDELLAAAARGPRPGAARAKLSAGSGEWETVLRLDIGPNAGTPTIEGKGTPWVRLMPASAPAGLHHLHGPAGRWVLALRTTRSESDARSAGEFLVAQFKAAVGERPALARTELERDSGLGGLVELFRYADRDGDDRLTLAELEQYLRLIELGVRAQVWVRIADRDRNPFPFLDADGDGRLSYREWTRATDLLAPDAAERDGLPLQFHLSFGGAAVRSWAGVPQPAARRPRPPTLDVSRAPGWFRAMDRNGDGVLSPWEFVGPPEVFRRLDLNGDGVITAEEAARAGNR
jgi:Ca2+-binding EF-hand superfamily protein